jgi:hypothetical protein
MLYLRVITMDRIKIPTRDKMDCDEQQNECDQREPDTTKRQHAAKCQRCDDPRRNTLQRFVAGHALVAEADRANQQKEKRSQDAENNTSRCVQLLTSDEWLRCRFVHGVWSGLTTQAQRPGAREATLAPTTR